jgi:hypothetical protein
MAGTKATAEPSERTCVSELTSFQSQLAALAETASDYPVEYSLGSYELLFESRDDIEIVVANLDESIADLRHTA